MDYYELSWLIFWFILGWNHNRIIKFIVKSIKYIINSIVDFMKVLNEF